MSSKEKMFVVATIPFIIILAIILFSVLSDAVGVGKSNVDKMTPQEFDVHISRLRSVRKIEKEQEEIQKQRALAKKQAQRPPEPVKNAIAFCSAMDNFDYRCNDAPNKLQKSRIEKEKERYIVGFNAIKWDAVITKIDSGGKVKMDTEVSSIYVYFNISANSRQVENWRVGDSVMFSGTIGKCFLISYRVSIHKIAKI